MWARVFTAVLCLLALLTEITFDSSTSFVRVNLPPVVGTLAIVKTPIQKQQEIPNVPNIPTGTQSEEGSDDLAKFSGASHASNVPLPTILSVLVPIARLVIYSDPPYAEPRLSNPQRPPSV